MMASSRKLSLPVGSKFGPFVVVAAITVFVHVAIYGHDSNIVKSRAYLRLSLVPGAHNTIGTLDDQARGKKRRILKQGLSDAKIRTVDVELRSAALTFAEGLGEDHDQFYTSLGSTSTFDLNHLLKGEKVDFEVMSHIALGTFYNLLRPAQNHWIVEFVTGQMRHFLFLMQPPELEDMGLHRFLFPEARHKGLRFVQKSREIMEARRARCDKDAPGLIEPPPPGGPLEIRNGRWLGRWRKRQHQEQQTDLFVPMGLEAATGIYALNHSAAHFPDPMTYRPER
ncbi:hypothetical protein PpBr36_09090 [Pyricularia pennisetigena]|uniref:hypothetical protein n=1 Tax=Pyricularia pennisetigena TaxID=1578925 RepID=UPI00114D99C6|nr:hypothetical protein PpBr36_09090 [Pyricularia pennisetigena]TLS24841.1 hypothetical protein PpBr36_09090 [Pyricularia pennisetigena]